MSAFTPALFIRRWPLQAAALLLALAVLLLSPGAARAQSSAPSVTGVAVTSGAGPDKTYALGQTIRVTLTFSEAVNVTGTPYIKIDMDPADWGTKWASYSSGSGGSSIVFAHTVVEPNISTQGVAVLADSLRLYGGSMTSVSSGTAAALSHAGLDHDPNHKVNWQVTAPTVTGVSITSDPGDDDTYDRDDVIEVTLTFSETVNVEGTPRVTIKMDPSYGAKRVYYSRGSGSTALTFAHTVVEPNISTQGVAVLADSLRLNGGTIRSVSSHTDVERAHVGLAHDPNHKVNWQQSAPTVPVIAITSDPGEDDTYANGEVIEVSVAFSEDVTVTGTPQIAIDMDPADWGTKWAAYVPGVAANVLTFAHTVVEPNISTQGIAVLPNSLRLNGGTIASSATGTAANLAHAGLAHDSGHKVNWQFAASDDTEVFCQRTAPSSVSALTIGKGAVVSWTLPDNLDDSCEVTGFVVTALSESSPIGYSASVSDTEARTHTFRDLTPGDYRFSVGITYAEGDSDDYVTMFANSVPDACITLAVKPYARNAVSGRITSVNGTGCEARETFDLELKRSSDDYFRAYSALPWKYVDTQTDASLPHFIFYGIPPHVAYDFRISAYDASNSKYSTTAQSVTIRGQDPSATADASSPTFAVVEADNGSGIHVEWDTFTAPTGRTLAGFALEWKTCSDPNDASSCSGTASTATALATATAHRITGLTDGAYYTVRVAASTHVTGQQPTTATSAWSVWAPPVRAWSEPRQLWFVGQKPEVFSGRMVVEAMTNRPEGTITCTPWFLNSPRPAERCLRGTRAGIRLLVMTGTVGVNAQLAARGETTLRTNIVRGDVNGPSGFTVGVSGGAAKSDGDASTHEGRFAIGWESALGGARGTIDAYVVQWVKQNTDGTWPNFGTTNQAIKASTDRSHTVTGLEDGNYAAVVWARAANSEDHDNNPLTPDITVHYHGFHSEFHIASVSAANTEAAALPHPITVIPGDSQSLIVEWALVTTGSLPYAYQVRHREEGTTTWTESEELFPRVTQRICNSPSPGCVNPRQYEIELLTGGTIYEVELRAKNANGWSGWSHTRTARPND